MGKLFVRAQITDVNNKKALVFEAPGVGEQIVTLSAVPAGLALNSYFIMSWPDMAVAEKDVVAIADGDITLSGVTKITTKNGIITATT